jgi:hypothetical protein
MTFASLAVSGVRLVLGGCAVEGRSAAVHCDLHPAYHWRHCSRLCEELLACQRVMGWTNCAHGILLHCPTHGVLPARLMCVVRSCVS